MHLGLHTISPEGKWPKRNPQRKGSWRKAPGERGRGVGWGVRVGVVLEAVSSSPEKATETLQTLGLPALVLSLLRTPVLEEKDATPSSSERSPAFSNSRTPAPPEAAASGSRREITRELGRLQKNASLPSLP